jgi:hypothetical protein
MDEEQPPAFEPDRDQEDEQPERDESGYEGAGVEEGGGYQRSPEEGGGYEQSGQEGGGYDPRREGQEP